MSILEELHQARKERLARFAAAAGAVVQKTAPIKMPECIQGTPKLKFERSCGFLAIIPPYEWAWEIEMCREEDQKEKKLHILQIQRVIADYYGMKVIELRCDRRTANVVRPRQVMFYICRRLTTYSLPEIGRKCGGRDHTTVLHGVRKIERLLTTDAKLKADVDTLIERLGGEPS